MFPDLVVVFRSLCVYFKLQKVHLLDSLWFVPGGMGIFRNVSDVACTFFSLGDHNHLRDIDTDIWELECADSFTNILWTI
jgi:hypothetical protein